MKYLTADDVFLVLGDMLTVRKADLELSGIGKIYSGFFASRRAEYEALPEYQRGERVHATALANVDINHDAFGTGIWFYTEAVRITPDVSAAARDAAMRVRAAFIPERDRLGDSYATEAATAQRNRPKLDELKDDLKLLPVPDGKSLLDWVKSFVDTGDELNRLLSDRSTTEASRDGKAASELRVKTIGLFGRLRHALRDEIAENPALPRDLEARVFAYIDELAARREQNKPNDPTPPVNTPKTG